jgi:outer membrane autotransporter protein
VVAPPLRTIARSVAFAAFLIVAPVGAPPRGTAAETDFTNGLVSAYNGEVFGSLATVGVQSTSIWLDSVAHRIRPSTVDHTAADPSENGGILRNPVGDAPPGADSPQLVSHDPALSYSTPTTPLDLPALPRRFPIYDGWSGGYGTLGDASPDGTAQGLDYGFAGTSFGVDRDLGEGTTLGFAGGYSGSHVQTDNLRQEAEVDSYRGAIYGSRVGERYYAINVLSYGFNNYDTGRRVPLGATARGKYNGDEISDYLEVGMSLKDQSRTWQPSLHLQYAEIRQESVTETGAGNAGLFVGSHADHSLRPGAGLRCMISTALGPVRLTPDLHARYSYELIDVEAAVTTTFMSIAGGPFTSVGNRLGRHFGQIGFGVDAGLSERFRCYGGYDLLTADTSLAHAGWSGLEYLW